jgi:mannose-1-phosphate guanylyltransferase
MRPKQFLKVLRDDEGKPESMVQRTVRLVKAQSAEASITVATSEDQVVAIKEQLSGDYALSVEPQRRDTAPAIMLGAAH